MDDEPPPLVEGDQTPENGIDDLDQWLSNQEQWLANERCTETLDIETDWNTLFELYGTVQRNIESSLNHQENWLDQLNQLPVLDQRRVALLQKWNETVPVTITRYMSLLERIASFQDDAISMTQLLVARAREHILPSIADHSESTANRDTFHLIQESLTRLVRQKEILEITQLVKPLQLIAIPVALDDESEVLLLTEREEEDAVEADYSYKEVTMATEKVGLLILECQGLIGQMEVCLTTVSKDIIQTKDKLMSELETVEAWLHHVQQWMWMEPQRMFDQHGSRTRESSMQNDCFTEEEDEEHPELLLVETPSPDENGEERDENDGESGENEDRSKSQSPLLDNGSDLDSPGLPPPHLEYEDEELSVEEEEEEKDGEREDITKSPLSLTLTSDNILDDSDLIQPEDVEGQVFTPDTPEDKGVFFTSFERPPPPLFNLSGSKESLDAGDSTEAESMEGSLSSYPSYVSSEGGSSYTEDDEDSLDWIQNIRLFEYRLSSTEEDMLQEEDRIPYSELIQQLQSIQSSIPAQSQLKDAVLSTADQLLASVKSPGERREIQLRLDNIKNQWKDIEKRVGSRLAEMKFERRETELLDWLFETKSELDSLPKGLLLPEEMAQSLKEFKNYFEDSDQLSTGEQLLTATQAAMEELCQCCEEEEDRVPQIMTTFKEALDMITEKVASKQQQLQGGVKLWEEFESVTTPLNEWMEKVEVDVKEREVYGNNLQEAKQFRMTVISYRESLREKYEMLKKLVSIGNHIVTMVTEGGTAYRHIDTVVCGTTQRWQELVNLLNSTDQELSTTLIKWQEYVELYAASHDFISHIHQIAGIEPVEGSQGDVQLLPKFIQLQTEIDVFQSKLEHLHLIKKELNCNCKVGGKESVEEDMSQLESDWSIVCGVTQGSLDHLWEEHESWLQEKLETMTKLLSKGEELLGAELEFVRTYPLEQLLYSQAKQLLQKVKDMTISHEDKFFDIEEELCQLQTEVDTRQRAIAESANCSKLEQSLTAEIMSMSSQWETVQSSCGTLSLVFQLITAQLELVTALQTMRTAIDELGRASGYRSDIERKVDEATVAFSEAKFESLRQLNYDLDTVYRESYVSLDKQSLGTVLTLPSNQDVLEVHKQLNSVTMKLSMSSKVVMAHFVLLLDWWKEYEQLSEVYWEWSREIEPQVLELQERTDLASPDDSPQSLFTIAQKLLEEFSSRDSLFVSVTTSLQNIIHDFNDKQVPSETLSKELTHLQNERESLGTHIQNLYKQLEDESNKLNDYLKKLSLFSERLNAAYTELYDECCTAISPSANPETLARQKMKFEKFTALMQEMSEEFAELQQSGERWGFRHIPEEWIEEFRETSPALSDDYSESAHCSVGRQLSTSEGRLSAMKRMLQERALDLELCEGNTAAIMTSANELLEWVEESLGLSFLNEAPPGEFEKLLQNKESLENLREAFQSRKHLLEKLHQLAATSKGSLSEVNLRKIETLMSRLDAAWSQMEQSVEQSTLSTEEVLAMMEVFERKCATYEKWLEEAERTMKECGPIGADLERIEQQEQILEVLNSDIREHKKAPEDLKLEVTGILRVAQEGTGDRLEQCLHDLTERYEALAEQAAESIELCEMAKKDMQDFAAKEEEFGQFLSKVTEDFKKLADKPKRPVGNTQETLDEHTDYCVEVESQSELFNQLYQFGLHIANTYVPCDTFKEHLQNLFDQWLAFVDSLNERWLQIKGLQGYWRDFEGQVAEFLNWVTEEAKRFSREVTSTDGEKGVVDHMEACKGLHNTLNEKVTTLDEISDLGDILKPDDGEKANGTKDVESRLNDVQIHWSSICQLLDETLEQLSSVHEKLCLISDITNGELDWLNQISLAAADKTSTRGVIEVLNDEIDRHKVYLDELEQHRPSIEVVMATEPFMLEHTRQSEHEAITKRVKDIAERFETLEGSERVYVTNLVKSVPLWEEFNRHRTALSQWVQEAEGIYSSDKLTPGNAITTEQNLRNAEELSADIDQHKPTVAVLSNLMKQLSEFCIADDCTFVSERTNQIAAHVETLSDSTEARRQMLDTRLKGWQVFPVEEAKNVQQLLDAIAMEIEEDEIDGEDEELSGEELLEKLKRLENLQDEQAARESNVAVIDKSVDSDEVKEALVKNPDISKERNNLLQGWNSASMRLSDKLTMMRLKTELTMKLEKFTETCRFMLDKYQTHLSLPLPPSPLLITIHDKWMFEQVNLSQECNSTMKDLLDYCDSYKDDPRIQIPKKFTTAVEDLRREHTALQQRGTEMTNQIEERMNEWKRYHPLMMKFSDWVKTSKSELSALSVFPLFLTEFHSLIGRFQMLDDAVKKKVNDYQYLNDNFEVHLYLVDKNGDGEERGVNVEEDEIDGEEGEQDDDQKVRELQKIFVDARKRWESLTAGVEAFPRDMKPWNDLVKSYDDLDRFHEDLENRTADEKEKLRKFVERDDNPAPVVERCKQIIEEQKGKAPQLAGLEESMNALITPDVCENYEPAQEFADQCKELRDKWNELENTTRHIREDAEQKAFAWEERAQHALAKVQELTGSLQDKERIIREKDDLLKRTQSLRCYQCLCAAGSGAFPVMIFFFVIVLIVMIWLRTYKYDVYVHVIGSVLGSVRTIPGPYW